MYPFETHPRSVDPDSGYVVVANNDHTGDTFDNDSSNDPVYITEDYAQGFRAHRITERIEAYKADATKIGFAEHASIQADVRSNFGHRVLPSVLPALASGAPECDDARFEVVGGHLQAWADAGYRAASGVETFYHPMVDAQEIADSTATTIFNTWVSKLRGAVLDDEALAGITWNQGSRDGWSRLLIRLLEAPMDMAGYDDAAGDHVFWDDTTTADATESRETIACRALTQALDRLESDERGGFGNADISTWLWGLRHHVAMLHPADEAFGADPVAGGAVSFLSVKPSSIPLMDDLAEDDPRASLAGFPRPGDNFNVDAAHPGFGEPDSFDYSSGASIRMIVRLGADGVESQLILPGGQVANPASPYWADQARLWLANERLPFRFANDDVAANGERRWIATP